jgi:hypothetical protein
VTRLFARIALPVVALLVSAPAAGLAAGASASYAAPTPQIAAVVVINGSAHKLKVTRKRAAADPAAFGAAARRALVEDRQQHDIDPMFAAPTKPVHHRLRYIAAGLILALAVIGGGVRLYTRSAARDSGEVPDLPSPPTT